MSDASVAAPRPLAFYCRLQRSSSLVSPRLLILALRNAVLNLNPVRLVSNPVVLIAETGAAVVTLLLLRDLLKLGSARLFDFQIAIWLWLTVLFANFGQSVARARAAAKADELRKSRSEFLARRRCGKDFEIVAASKLRVGDVISVTAGELIPVDGLIVEGIAMVDESVITGESAAVIRESGGALSTVTRGTRVLSDSLTVRVSATPTENLVERMITGVERSTHQKTRSEIALQTFVAVAAVLAFVIISFVFLFERVAIAAGTAHVDPTIASFVTLFICLVPTAIGALLPVVGIAGMERLIEQNVLAVSRKVLESAREVDTVLLDKTGTLTFGLRTAVEFVPLDGHSPNELARVARLASIFDDTHEGRSIVALAEQLVAGLADEPPPTDAGCVPFSAYTRMSGIDLDDRIIRKGATTSVASFVREAGGLVPGSLAPMAKQIALTGGTPLAIAEGREVLGIVHLRDAVKPGATNRIAELRTMGVRSVLVTGDNPVTARAIADEAGVDDIIAQATPADKLAHVKRRQNEGHVVAMIADGSNDAPALAQADIGLAMNDGTVAAKEAGNMLDLDSDPAKILEIVALSRQIYVTRIALLVFSIITGIVLCATVLPVILAPHHPRFAHWNFLNLRNPESAVLSAAIVNAVLILFLCPAALNGVRFRPVQLRSLLVSNVAIYLAGAVLIPLPLLRGIDLMLGYLHLA